MDFGKVWDFIAEKNIEPQAVLALVDEVKKIDVNDEDDLRRLIRKVAMIAHKDIPYDKETMIVKKIQKDGIDLSLLNFF